MEFRTLKALVEVVRQGGFSQAAKVLFATQSTVSKAVKQLEDELDLPLLDRLGHHSRLTAAGEIVYRRAVRLLAERDDLAAELAELKGLKRGVLRLGLPPIGSSTLFAPFFAAYRQRHPAIEIRLALQLLFIPISESMDHHDSGGHGWRAHRLRRRWSFGRRRCGM